MFWVSVWVLGLFEYRSGSHFCTNLQNILWIWNSFLKRFITFKKLKWLFSKIYICGELHWKVETFLSWTLFVKFWMSERSSRLKKWQFLISAKFSMGCFSETIRDTELKFSGISYLIDVSTWSKFHQNLRRSPGKMFKNWSFFTWPL